MTKAYFLDRFLFPYRIWKLTETHFWPRKIVKKQFLSQKIDQSFIRNLPGSAEDAQITRTIIAMAHNLGLGVIAEGVETPAQHTFLREIECEELQGYLFSQPVPIKRLVENFRHFDSLSSPHYNWPCSIENAQLNAYK